MREHARVQRFARLLRGRVEGGGRLALMTRLLDDDERFARWHYVRDPTHTSFYQSRTLEWIAARFRWQVVCGPSHVTIFRKVAGTE